MNANKILFILIVALFSTTVFAQKHKFQFGRPLLTDLDAKYHEDDRKAVAAILYESCFNQIYYNTEIRLQEGFVADIVYKTRVKIYKNEGRNFAGDTILLYIGQSRIERLLSINVVTCNIENGKLKKTILPQSEIERITLPNGSVQVVFNALDVREGSIVDIKYKIRTPYLYELPGWHFQRTIPIRFSSYSLAHPQFMDYQLNPRGFIKIKKESYTSSNRFLPTSNLVDNEYPELIQKLSATNVPAFHLEPHISSKLNYISNLDMNLEVYEGPGGSKIGEAYTWKGIGEWLLSKPMLGGQLGHGSFMKEDIKNLTSGLEDPQAITMAVLNYVRQKVKWNRKGGLFCEQSIKTAYKKEEGSAVEINLLLVNALKIAGIKAFPVALRLRKSGVVNDLQPSERSFNYVIAGVKLDDEKTQLLDGIAINHGLDLLPKYCMNGSGLTIDRVPEWIELPRLRNEISYVSEVTLDEDGKALGTLKYIAKNHAACELRNRWARKGGNNRKMIRDIDWDNDRFKTVAGNVENIEDLNKAVAMELTVDIRKSTKLEGDKLFFNPIFIDRIEENPFVVKNRKYPIELLTPIKRSFVMTLTIPEGYKVAELPQAEVVKLSDKGGRFSYNVAMINNQIQIVYSYSINRIFFQGEERDYLKQFYAALIRKHAEQIVLQKK